MSTGSDSTKTGPVDVPGIPAAPRLPDGPLSTDSLCSWQTVADLRAHLGGIPTDRIRLSPPPGTATEEDLLAIQERDNRLLELVDGVLVEKTVGYYESLIATWFAHYLRVFLEQHDLGIVLGADGPVRLLPNQVREPDVAFVSWRHFPNRKLPRGQILNVAPDLVIEVLSPSNTAQEMDRKLREYFQAGTRLVWYVHPGTRQVTAFSAVSQSTVVTAEQSLNGGEVLPGFELSIRELFAKVGERE